MNDTAPAPQSRRSDLLISLIFALGGVVLVAGGVLLLGPENWFGRFLFDTGNPESVPFSVQNLMWIVFFFGLGQIYVRYRASGRETAELGENYLPTDPEVVIEKSDLGPIYRKTQSKDDSLFLPRILKRIILQVNLSGSATQATEILNASLDLFQQEVELRYTVLQYIIWLIPTLGFIGTVLGLTNALGLAGTTVNDSLDLIALEPIFAKLGVAFFTTLLALIMSGVLVLLMNVVQAREEAALNRSGQHTLDYLINKILLD